MSLYIGLMSGTSLDGVDGVLSSIPDEYDGGEIGILETAHVPFDGPLRQQLMSLQLPGHNEIEKEALAANRLSVLYAECVYTLLQKKSISAENVRAIGAHGQTIRHRPELGFTRQTNNPALLAERFQKQGHCSEWTGSASGSRFPLRRFRQPACLPRRDQYRWYCQYQYFES